MLYHNTLCTSLTPEPHGETSLTDRACSQHVEIIKSPTILAYSSDIEKDEVLVKQELVDLIYSQTIAYRI